VTTLSTVYDRLGANQRMLLESPRMAAYARSGYAEKVVAERVGGQAAGWGA
jgi:L-rhamnose isomerase / sugar isomerase